MSINQEVKHVNGLDHAVVCRHEASGGQADVVPSRLTGNPKLDAFIFGLTVGIVCNVVDNHAFRKLVVLAH